MAVFRHASRGVTARNFRLCETISELSNATAWFSHICMVNFINFVTLFNTINNIMSQV